jgi:hypothetical protein
MSSGDLKHLLQDLAAEGSTTVELDEQHLVPRIRARRRRRAGVVAAVAASTAVVLAAGAYVVLPGGEREQPPAAVPEPTVTLASPGWVTPFACGATFTAPLTGDSSALRLAVPLQEVVRAAKGSYAPIVLQVTNVSGKPLDLFGTPGGPHIFVVKNGVVVGSPLGERMPGHRWRFDPGQTLTLRTAMDTQRCNREGQSGPAQLEPGTYQLYAMKTFSPYGDEPARGEFVVAGGPWTIQLK